MDDNTNTEESELTTLKRVLDECETRCHSIDEEFQELGDEVAKAQAFIAEAGVKRKALSASVRGDYEHAQHLRGQIEVLEKLEPPAPVEEVLGDDAPVPEGMDSA